MNNSQRFWRGLFFIFMITALCTGLALPAFEDAPVRAAPPYQSPTCNLMMAQWTFDNLPTGANPSPAFSDLASDVTSAIASVGDITSPAIGTTDSRSSPNNFYARGFTSGATLDTGNNDYFQFVVDTTHYSNVNLSFYALRSTQGPDTMQVYYSVDGTTFNALAGTYAIGTAYAASPFIADMTGLTSTSDVTYFRIYGWNAEGTAGTVHIDDITFTGCSIVTINSIVPNPTNNIGTSITWHSMVNGSYEIRLGGTSCADGTVIASGTYTNPSPISSPVNGSDLVEGLNTIYVCIDDLSATHFATGSITKDTIAPTVTISRASGQAATTGTLPINFSVVFSEPIDASTFAPGDVTQSGTATGITWSIVDSGDHRTFTLSATGVTGAGTLVPSIAANVVRDPAGNNNDASSSTDIVTYTAVADTVRPTVTFNQAIGQADPALGIVPIRFTVVFSEPIDTSTFTVEDISQNGTAPGVTWDIDPLGDDRTFTILATPKGAGTVAVSIPANRVKDLAGNNNTRGTKTDNTVTFRTPMTVIINEVAWMGTGPNALAEDEWIELYNPNLPSSPPVDLTGWSLRTASGSLNISLNSVTLASGGFYLLERGVNTTDDNTVVDVAANQIYSSGSLSNSGEILQLWNGSQLIDSANANGGMWPAGNASASSSSTSYSTMERRGSTVVDGDTAWITNAKSSTWFAHNANCTLVPSSSCSTNTLIHGTPGRPNWAFSVTATPSRTPTRTRTPTPTRTRTRTPTPLPPPPLVAINEFVPRPGHDWNLDGVINTGDEYIELLNHGVIDVNLSGYLLDDEANIGSEPYSLPSVVLKPGERIVFYGSDTNLLLSDGGDGVRLLKSNGQLADAYNYFVVRFPDQSYCRLPDNGGLDDWNQNCFPTPGLQNSLSGSVVNPPTSGDANQLCPIADTLPDAFLYAECPPFGNIWNREYWDRFGWFDEKYIPGNSSKWPLFAD